MEAHVNNQQIAPAAQQLAAAAPGQRACAFTLIQLDHLSLDVLLGNLGLIGRILLASSYSLRWAPG